MHRSSARRLQSPDDARLPQLVEAMDEVAMADILQRNVAPAASRQPMRCTIQHVKYKPGKKCLICYRLTPLSGTHYSAIYSATVYPLGESASRYKKAVVAAGWDAPIWHIESLAMIVWAFPYDRKLRSLPLLTNPDTLQNRILPDLLRQSHDFGWEIDSADSAVAHYVPEHHCTIKVDMRIKQRGSSAAQTLTIYGKTYYNGAGEHTCRAMQDIQQHVGSALTAQALAYQPDYQTLWQLSVPGKQLFGADFSARQNEENLPKAAVAIARLHRLPIHSETRIDKLTVLCRVGQVHAMLCGMRPSCKSTADALKARLFESLPKRAFEQQATLHGDLHPQNILIDGEQAVLIDMDSVALGPPLADIGSWCAAMLYRTLLLQSDRRETIAKLASFVGAYARHVDWDIDTAALNWFTAVALLNERASRCMSRLKPGRLQILDDIIELAAHISYSTGFLGGEHSDEHGRVNPGGVKVRSIV